MMMMTKIFKTKKKEIQESFLQLIDITRKLVIYFQRYFMPLLQLIDELLSRDRVM